MNFSTKKLKRLINIYPPYLGAGIKVIHINNDWKELHVSMKLKWYNRNIVGTHFGGSLYSMIDPHLMIMLMNLLGRDYIVWDKSAEIEFVKATKKRVVSKMKITDDEIAQIKENVDKHNKYLASFNVEIKDDEDNLIAKAKKVVYIRKKNAGRG
jgi:acyl-coenzyme A thioesterase PaaI-like protein